jgi:predicted PurR-regulated permease PerM
LYTFASNLADSPRWKESITQSRDRARTHSDNLLERTVGIINQFLPDDQQRTPEDIIQEIRDSLRRSLQGLGDRSLGDAASITFGVLAEAMGTLVAILIGLLIYSMALYYFLADGSNLTSAAEQLIPVHADYQRQLLGQFSKVVRSVVVATFLAAFGQGLATAVALKLFGFPHAFVLFILATLASLIPIIGAWLVWLPCVIVLFLDGHWIQATILFLYGSMFVGMLDNVIRTYVLNTDTRLHPLLAFISILGGMQVMGLWGVFIGPIVASCLHALVQIFNVELKEFSKERQQEESSKPDESGTKSDSNSSSDG